MPVACPAGSSSWWTWGLGLLALWVAVHLIFNEVALYDRGIRFLPLDWVAGIAAVLLGIEFTRRTTGWLIPTLIVIAMTYVIWWGKYVTGVFQFPGLTLENSLFRAYFSGDGMFGSIARISSTYVFMFILFGAFLTRSGAGDFIMNLARCAAGKMTGGPGLVAVMGSALMGTISGSAVANVVGTGVITIPLMKRAGFPGHFAASVEASASTGGRDHAADHGCRRFRHGQLYQYSLRSHHRRLGAARHHVFPVGRLWGADAGDPHGNLRQGRIPRRRRSVRRCGKAAIT